MQAMTWYDHETDSIWSQPTGRAIDGELLGTELFLLLVQLTTWGTWRAEHPETLVMTNDLDHFARFRYRAKFQPDFVIGVVWAGQAKAYRYADVLAVGGIINDMLGDVPVLIWAENENFHTYMRRLDGRTLTFHLENGELIDEETGSTWDIMRGLATAGPLQGAVLPLLPNLTAFEDHWWDFYPDSTLYAPK